MSGKAFCAGADVPTSKSNQGYFLSLLIYCLSASRWCFYFASLYVATYAFVPLSTETFGRLGKPAMALLNKLAECASASGVVLKDGFVVNALRELSVGLCRGNCVLYKRSQYALARVSGTFAFRAGADIPVYENI